MSYIIKNCQISLWHQAQGNKYTISVTYAVSLFSTSSLIFYFLIILFLFKNVIYDLIVI
jgi:hypothetical protein